MNLTHIGFFTPIQYGHGPISWRQKAIECIDGYFHLGGRVALVIGLPDKDGKEPVNFQNSPFFCWQSIVKVMLYAASFFSGISATLFASTATHSIIQALTLFSCFPALMLAAKIVLRATSRFYLPSPAEIALKKALDAICDPSFYSRLKAIYYTKKADLQDEQAVWLSTVLELFISSNSREK